MVPRRRRPGQARRGGALSHVVQDGRVQGSRDPIRHVRGAPLPGQARPRGRRPRARDRGLRGALGEGGGPGLRRLRGQSRMARALSRPSLGLGEGAGHPVQHRRRSPHGHGAWRPTPWTVDGLPFDAHRKLTDKTNRLSYPYGVLVNARGARFFDEGEDFQFYTYAKLGGITLNEPGGIGWQIFDSKVLHLLEGRYKTGTPETADSLDALVDKLPLDRAACRRTLEAYNHAVGEGRFDPTIRDGLATHGLALPKSNWAQRLDTPPFVAYPTTGGITFTFGGVRVNERAQILGASWTPIPGLYACGEMVGGLFHGNYPGGTGLMSGAVFGRLAGAQATGSF